MLVVPKPCQRVLIFLLFALLINVIVFLITPQSPSHVKRRYLETLEHQHYGESSAYSGQMEEEEEEEEYSGEIQTETSTEIQTDSDLLS